MFKYLIVFLLLFSLSVNAGKKHVTPISPSEFERVKSLRPILKWKKYPGAKFYHLRWFEKDPVTRSTIKTKQGIKTFQTEYQFKEDLIQNRVYHWQVDPCGTNGRYIPEATSSRESFLTGTIIKGQVKILKNRYDKKRKKLSKIFGGAVRNVGPPFMHGVWILNIQKGGLAEKYGFKNYDIITKCNEQPIKNINDLYKQVTQGHYGFTFKFVRRIVIPQSAIRKHTQRNDFIDPSKCKKEVEILYKKAEVAYKNKEYGKAIMIIENLLLLDIYNQKAIGLLRKEK